MATCRLLQLPVLVVIFLQILYCNGTTDSSLTRKLHTESLCINTTIDNVTQEVKLMHTEAEGPNDTLHYVFSTYGIPSVLVVRTDRNGQIDIKCDRYFSGNRTLMEKSVSFTHSHYAYAVMFNRLLEYNDTEDYADVEKYDQNSTEWNIFNLNDITWVDLAESTDVKNNKIMFTLDEKPGNNLTVNGNGSFSLSMEVIGEYTREGALPHLEYNANMTQFELLLDNVNTSFASSRFALEMTMVSMDGVPNKMALNTQTYIDDEHSPGVFEMIDWTTKGKKQDWSGFFQFKPVCYTSPSRTLNDATKAKYYPLVTPNATDADPLLSLVYAYFGEGMYLANYSMTMANVSFGLGKDKFYRHTNYTIWAASIGFGTPPADELSLLIIIILSVGLGLPIILISFGSIGICIKKKMKRDSPYEEISSSSPDIN